jgi:hypothetical protein
MFTIAKPQKPWSDIGIRVLIGSVIASVAFAFFDGILRGIIATSITGGGRGLWEMVATWAQDFRYLANQGVYAATVFTVGAKFIETRTLLSIGFDKLDTDKTTLNGPDENNVVWIGHRYGTRFEAEAVASVLAERLKESAA